MNLMIVEETPKLEIGGKTSQGLLWRTFRRQVSSRVENVEKVSQGIPSPYWNYDYTSTPVLSKSNAGIGQRIFTGFEYDEQSNLHYAGARYYDQDIGKWISQDPVFQNLGTDRRTAQALRDPQSQNAYSYVKNNPLRLVDDNGEWFREVLTGQQSFSDFQVEVGQATQQMTQDSAAWNYAVSNPYTTGALVGALSAPAAEAGLSAIVAGKAATAAGVGAAYAAKQATAAIVYGTLYAGSLNTIPGTLNVLGTQGTSDPSRYGSTLLNVGSQVVPTFVGGYVGALADTIQFAQTVVNGLVQYTNSIQNSAGSQKESFQTDDRN